MLLKDMMSLAGKTAIVTGGTGWLGAQMCEALCEQGATVYSISRGHSKEYVEHLRSCTQFHTLYHDLTNGKQLNQAVETILEKTGRIDVLVNNSFAWPKDVNFETVGGGQMIDTLNVGIVSPLMLTQRVLSEMVKAGKGSIINVASMYGHVSPDHRIYRNTPGMGNAIEYGAIKAALLQTTRYVAAIGGASGVRCNSISPGPFPRPGTFIDKAWFQEELSGRTMLRRVGESSELKGVIAFLASDLSSYVTGTDIAVDGGWTAW